MKIIMKTAGKNDGKAFGIGDMINVPDVQGERLIRRNLATASDDKPFKAAERASESKKDDRK